ncbi:MAG: hypothetical protein HYR88_19025 [Verrucomicrobia bacterium]|nr:hypothetical protein [Verrucomicrobiota bacterium]MBI3871334.1 hypothetical protein [Verrucomicrobiota bacterium]
MKTIATFSAVVLSTLLSCVLARAVDPLPPELENAPLEKKAEYWQRTSKESGALRRKVAQERYDHAVAYKEALLTQMSDSAAEVQARIQAQQQASQSSSFLETGAANSDEPPAWSVFTLIAGLLAGGAAFMHHNMRKAEQIV